MSRPLVGPRLQRVLALVPWILAHPGVTLTELAARFEVSEHELERDLELLPMCGLPPYTADRLIDVTVIDGEVEIRLAEYFERPLRLTPAEGLALLAAGRALLAVPGSDTDGPLATALDKLGGVLGAGGGLAVDVGASDQLERLQDATASDERVEIDYFSFARDEMTTRVIDPWRVFHAFGAWYIAAWCHRAEGERLTPEGLLAAKLPLFDQYLRNGRDPWSWRVWGLSAQGGIYEDPDQKQHFEETDRLRDFSRTNKF